MKMKGMILAASLSVISFSAFAADQVIKEKTTPAAAEGPITIAQIPPVFSPTTPAEPIKVQQPSIINQPVMPSNVSTAPTQTIAPQQSLQGPPQQNMVPANQQENPVEPNQMQQNQPMQQNPMEQNQIQQNQPNQMPQQNTQMPQTGEMPQQSGQ